MGGYIAVGAVCLMLGCFAGIAIMCMCIVGDYEDPNEGGEQDGKEE